MMDALAELAELERADSFVSRHIAPGLPEIEAMLRPLGCASLDELVARTVPAGIRTQQPMELPPAIDEAGAQIAHAAAAGGG